MEEELIPIVGEIYKVRLRSGRTWLFKSAYCGDQKTEHQDAYCIDCGDDDSFRDYVTTSRGCHVGDNSDIIELKPANLNEIAIFERNWDESICIPKSVNRTPRLPATD